MSEITAQHEPPLKLIRRKYGEIEEAAAIAADAAVAIGTTLRKQGMEWVQEVAGELPFDLGQANKFAEISYKHEHGQQLEFTAMLPMLRPTPEPKPATDDWAKYSGPIDNFHRWFKRMTDETPLSEWPLVVKKSVRAEIRRIEEIGRKLDEELEGNK